MIEKSGVERSRIEAWGWKVWGWNVLWGDSNLVWGWKVQGWKVWGWKVRSWIVHGWKIRGWKVWGWNVLWVGICGCATLARNSISVILRAMSLEPTPIVEPLIMSEREEERRQKVEHATIWATLHYFHNERGNMIKNLSLPCTLQLKTFTTWQVEIAFNS